MEKTSHIKFGFFVTSLAFTIPIVFLIYFMVQFKNENIDFAFSENVGTAEIARIIAETRNLQLSPTEFQEVIEKVSLIGDDSKLILDPDLDAYYIMDIVVNILPKTLGHLQQLNEPDISTEKSHWARTMIKEDMRQFRKALSIAQREDVKYFGMIEHLTQPKLAPFQKSLDLAVIEAFKSTDGDLHAALNAQIDVSGIYDLWSHLNNVLQNMVSNRIAQLQYERNIAVGITGGLWICSLIFVVFFSLSIANRQEDLYREIESQNLKLTASSKMSALGEMAGGIAHEINTPLAAIRLNSETMLEGLTADLLDKDDLIRVASSLIKISDRISAIIQSMRRLTRDASQDPLVEVSLPQIFNETMTLCSEAVRRKEVELTLDIPDDIRLHCNSVEISQVFINLINNAIDATSTQPKKWIKIKANKDHEFVTIRFSDGGAPIPRLVREKMFAPFFTTKPIGAGTGLGLGIARRIVEEHLGRLSLDEGTETCFIIKLPIDPRNLEVKDGYKRAA